MAEISRLVSKKLSGFLHSGKIETIEAFILDTILYKDLRKENGGVLCDMETIKIIVHRANSLKIEILGIETNFDDIGPFRVFIQEEHSQSPGAEWCISALNTFLQQNSSVVLHFYINMPPEQILS